jgi:hypothetical protein
MGLLSDGFAIKRVWYQMCLVSGGFGIRWVRYQIDDKFDFRNVMSMSFDTAKSELGGGVDIC